MASIFNIIEYVENTYLSDIRWLLYKYQFIAKIKKYNIKTIYIAPKEKYILYKSYINDIKYLTGVEVIEFSGGFKENSLVLFPFYTKEDLEYFNKITGLKVGIHGNIM